jgi:hypothetical protein
MTDLDNLAPTPDERVMAALSHVSILLPLMGVIAPIVIWVTQKEKSRYVAFQSLQALIYQLSMIIAWFLGMGCYMCSFFGMIIPLTVSESSSNLGANEGLLIVATMFPFFVMGALFLFGFAFIIYGVVGAIMAFQGKPFRYVIIGKRVERFMLAGQSETNAGNS